MRNNLDSKVVNRAIGAVCGGAAGDALGAGYEFTNPHPDDEISMKGGGAFNWAPGEWTDDTAMAVAILDGLISGHCDIEEIGNNFCPGTRVPRCRNTNKCSTIFGT